MKPIRTERTEHVDREPWNGDEYVAQRQDTLHALDAQGAIESHRAERRIAAACGCLQAPAGFCGECGQPVCPACYGRCVACGKPLCPRHSRFAPQSGGQPIRLCPSCGDAARRASAMRRVGRALLSVFVDFTSDNGPRHGER